MGRRVRTIAILGLATIGLAACGPSESTANVAAADAALANSPANGVDYLAEVAALPEGQQRIVLFRAIRDAQQQCQELTAIARQPDAQGRQVWFADCRGGARYRVDIQRNGVANVTGPILAD